MSIQDDETTAAPAPAAPNVSASAFAPLRHRLFFWLGIAAIASNIGTSVPPLAPDRYSRPPWICPAPARGSV